LPPQHGYPSRKTVISKPETRNQKPETVLALALCATMFILLGCEQQMADQPRYDPLEPSNFFADGQSARPAVENAIARGTLREDEHLYDGMTKGAPATTFPFPITAEVLQRGRERYDIFCSPCHSRTGNGDGMIVRRGFSRPASFNLERLREAPPGYLFVVMTNGFGAMPPYRQQISPEDRWAIVGYIRALQASQNMRLSDLPADAREKLMAEPR
jgi:mono/diheme cytochrome c family protein